MATIAENLQKVRNAKSALMTSINAKNGGAITNSTPFSAYPNAIDAIDVGGIDMSDKFVSGCLEIKDYSEPEFLLSRCVTSVNIPESVTSLGNYCFQNCQSLSEIAIPDSVTSIGQYCFHFCTSLTDITIPKFVTSLGNGCFNTCSKLTSVTCKATTPPTLGSSAFDFTHSTIVIYVPSESVAAYKSATNWSKYADKIQAIA